MSGKINPNLTPKQLQVLEMIREIRINRGYSPTMQELADTLKISKVTVFERIEALIKKGALLRQANKARSLELNPEFPLLQEEKSTRLPLMGTIAAGYPIEAIEDRQYVDMEDLFDMSTRSGNQTFALEVRGDSMIDEQIRSGDYVIIRRTQQAYNGQTVVALLENGEATLKKYYKEKNHIRLQPANDAYDPIIVHDCKIQGTVIGVIRTY